MVCRDVPRSVCAPASRSLVLLACLLLCLISLVVTSSATATRPPARVSTPTFRPLHVSFTILTSTRTHMVAPLEIAKVLASRGHRITIIHMEHHTEWTGTDEERRQSGFRYIVSDSDGRPIEESYNETLHVMIDQGIGAIVRASQILFEPIYAPSMRTHQRLVAEDRPDVMMCDPFAHSCVDLADKLGIPFVITFPGQLGDFALGDGFDTPSQLTGFSQYWHEQPMWHRFVNTFLVLPYAIWTFGGIEPRMNALRAQFDIAPNTTPLDKWAGRDVLFNGNWAFDYAGYLPPYYHLIGPVKPSGKGDMTAASNIAPKLREWLDESEQSGIPVVYMALGSMAWLIDSEQTAFVQAFSSCSALPLSAGSNSSSSAPHFRVVWQSNRPLAAATRAAMPEWVREEKWVAQPAVLSHPATSLFVTHVGASSMQEGIGAGLPLLAVPFWGDQPSNAMRLQDNGVAVKVEHQTVTADELCRAMRHLVYDKQVRANVDRLQQIYHLATDGAARGADIVERAAYVGTQHLIPYRERKDVSWIIRYNVDVYAIGVGIAALVVYGVYRLLAAMVIALLAMAVFRPKSKVA